MKMIAKLLTVFSLPIVMLGAAQAQPTNAIKRDVFGTSSCMGCHGQNAMGGLGGPLAQTKLSLEDFQKIVRSGKGMMPAIPVSEMQDDKVAAIHEQVKAMPWIPEEIPIAYKVGQFLSPKNVSHIFLAACLFFTIFAIRGIIYWVKLSGLKELQPAITKMGRGKAWGIVAKSLVVDGFLVGSLWKHDKKRWFMHGLMLYGFCGLILADILIAIANPQRSQLPFSDPLKLLPVLSGAAVLIGVCYVMYRYKADKYIDNGLTLGKDFLFVNFLVHTAFSGFLVVLFKRAGIHDWIMTIYIYHLAAVFLLIITGPFTRFQHIYVVPVLAAMTRLTDTVVASGAEIGFEREPSPGRHHKSLKITQSVLSQLGPEYDGQINMRYYP